KDTRSSACNELVPASSVKTNSFEFPTFENIDLSKIFSISQNSNQSGAININNNNITLINNGNITFTTPQMSSNNISNKNDQYKKDRKYSLTRAMTELENQMIPWDSDSIQKRIDILKKSIMYDQSVNRYIVHVGDGDERIVRRTYFFTFIYKIRDHIDPNVI